MKKKPDKKEQYNEVYKRHRPTSWDGVIGQDKTVKALQSMLERGTLPHALMLHGPSGSGKTTIARILKTEMGCSDMDFHEMNCADMRGIEDARNVRRRTSVTPMDGRVSMWLIDEAQKLTNDAQNALLKLLEDTPSHVYFIFCTTDPRKLIQTIKTRLTSLKLDDLEDKHLHELLRRVCSRENMKLTPRVESLLIQQARGSARMLLVLLDRISVEAKEAEQIEAIRGASFDEATAYDLAKAVFYSRPWSEVAPILLKLKNQDVEGVRHMFLSYCNTVMITDRPGDDPQKKARNRDRAYRIIDVFSRNFYDSKEAGLTAACWEVLT